jgi:hypothetical protein
LAELKLGEPFGLENALVDSIDWSLALQRIIHDQRSDFIYAPHLGFIYQYAGTVLIDKLKAELKSGKFSPRVPLTIEVPKSFRMRVAVNPTRLGPSYSRPGSILLPVDRLFYQALADQAAPIVANTTLSQRSFSHKLAEPNSTSMFLPTRNCWSDLQKALSTHSELPTTRYVLRIDVANFFGSLNQHILINTLSDAGLQKALSSRLEHLLTHYTGERSSRSILQGINPSDLFGNYYMTPIDQFLDDYGVPSARYVDDIYIFVDSVEAADRLLRELIPALRSYDLVLNEAKSALLPKAVLRTEEPDLEALFTAAVQEIASQLEDEELDVDYGFQSDWEEEAEEGEDDEQNLELEATKVLFGSIADYPGQEENIECFCLPLFVKAESDYAVDHAIDAMKRRPSMTQIYASYLSRFIEAPAVHSHLVGLMSDASLFDWQRMWVLAALLRVKPATDGPVQSALAILRDARRHDALRAVAAIYVGTYGNHARRKALIAIYSAVSPYVQATIYFSSRNWPPPERAKIVSRRVV